MHFKLSFVLIAAVVASVFSGPTISVSHDTIYNVQPSTTTPQVITPLDIDIWQKGVVEIGTTEGHGSGFGFRYVEEEGQIYTEFLTNHHVVAYDHPSDNDVWFVRWFDKTRGYQVISAKVYWSDRQADVAIVRARGSYPIFELASVEEVENLREFDPQHPNNCDLVVSTGWPSDIEPSIVGVGVVLKVAAKGIHHSSACWYGCSGSPVFSVATKHVIGITERFDTSGYWPASNSSWAIHIRDVRDVIKEYDEQAGKKPLNRVSKIFGQ